MYKKTIILAIILMAMGTHAFADPTITVSRTPGTYPPIPPGPFSGEFTLTPNGELMAITGETGPFQSFCVEVHEGIGVAIDSTYGVFLNNEAILGDGRCDDEPPGSLGDLLDPRTAYLYSQFRAVTLDGYDYVPGPGGTRPASALALQTAIWHLECETGYQAYGELSEEAQAFVDLADAEGWTDIDNVRVLNVYDLDNPKLVAQDMLVMAPPPPPPECDLEVIKEACVVTPGGNQCYKGNKIKSMILEYTGDGCGASSHSQKADKVKCDGDPSAAEPVDISATDKKLKKNWGSAFDIPIGGHILVDAANEGKNNLDAETKVIITNPVGDVIQEVSFHTSCSQPLAVGDQFGSMLLTSLTTTEGGTVGSEDTCSTEIPATGADVEYTYTITNTGPTTVTGVTVIDDVFGVVPGSPIPSILAGESVVLTLTVFLSDETTNIVDVTAAEGCSAEATATITKAPPEPPKCTTKVQAMLLEYIGPDVSGPVTVTIKADKFKEDLVSYTFGGNLVPGTILSSVAENDWTIDATAHGQSELGAKVSIRINGVEEKIHTSCSTPFVSGQPAPLDGRGIKGDPSPNWFVVDFVQK